MSSYRITLKEEAAPVVVSNVDQTTGAMVIRAPKGNAQPFKINKGEDYQILRKFGYPSASFPDIQEALDFVEDSDLWVSAPSNLTTAKTGGAIVLETGTVGLTMGVDVDSFDFATVDWKTEIGEGDGVVTNFVFSLPYSYVNLSASKLIVGSTEIELSVTDVETEVVSGTGISAGTIVRSTGEVDITLSTAPADGAKVYIVYQADMSDAYFAIFQDSPTTLGESVKVTYDTDLSMFNWSFYIKDYKNISKLIDTYSGSNIPDTFNASNENIFMEVYHADNPYFVVKANTDKTYSAFTDDSTEVTLTGGVRSNVFTSSEIGEGWDYFKEANTYSAKLFVDVTGDSSVPALFNTLRTAYQPYSRYLIVLPDSEDADDSIVTKAGYSIDNRGLCFYSNWFMIQERYTGTKFWSCRMGKTAVKHAEIIRQAFGGLAPSWINENGLGGQLSGTTLKARYDYSETDLQNLDSAGINPRIFHRSYGLMITSQKTGTSPASLTDFSYIAHSGAADYIIERVMEQVLTPQITKLNDERHRTKVKALADILVSPVQGASIISNYINKCDSENNNAEVLNRREFVLTTAVQFTPTSEYIVYNFRSAPQGVSLEEVAS